MRNQPLPALAARLFVSRAAAACFVTQSTLSASIKELETLLDTTLIERARRWVMLTSVGHDVVARARAVVREVEDLVAAGSGEPLSGPLRLGVIPTIGPYLLPQVLLMAFPYGGQGLETFVFADDPFRVAFPPGHRFQDCERVDQAELDGENLLLLEEGHCLRDHALSLCDLDGATGADAFQATSLQTLVQMVDYGLGLTLLPKMAIDAGITKGTGVAVRPLTAETASRRIGVAWRKSSNRAREFTLLGGYFRDRLAATN